MTMIPQKCCICATLCPPPDFVSLWRLMKAAGYDANAMEDEFKSVMRDGKGGNRALFKAVQTAIARLREDARLERQMELEWERSQAEC